ncbi:MAG TPA: SRPBCC family protein [Actinomycetota bacterium]|nr:SRPBCC family protein [Actinomycetota bacterium]
MTVAPIDKTLRVACSQAHAFETFVDRISEWWPLERHSTLDDARTCVFEHGVGGRVFERSGAGEEATWGMVVVWEPPARVVFSWNPTGRPAETEVEVRFVPDGDGTVVELEHRGWDRLADGLETRPEYDSGWDGVLARYADVARGRDAAAI